MKKPVYIRCPRCELNFIQKKDKFCSVCKAEMEAKKDNYDEDELDLELCPICKTNYIQPDEIMCSSCLKEHRNEDGELASDWEDYLIRDDEEDSSSMFDELGDMASVNDITKSGLLDDDDIPAEIDFDDDDIQFEDEEFDDSEEEENAEDDELNDEFDEDLDDFDDDDFDDDDDEYDDDDDFDDED